MQGCCVRLHSLFSILKIFFSLQELKQIRLWRTKAVNPLCHGKRGKDNRSQEYIEQIGFVFFVFLKICELKSKNKS